MPVRTAAEQFAAAGCEASCYAALPAEGLVFIRGMGGRCVMRDVEWAAYQRLCLAGGAVVSMRAVAEEEEEPFAAAEEEVRALSREDLGRIYASLGSELRQIRELVRVAKTTLSIEDYGDALTGAHDRLSLCVGCVDELLRTSERAVVCDVSEEMVKAEREIERLRERIREQGVVIERGDEALKVAQDRYVALLKSIWGGAA